MNTIHFDTVGVFLCGILLSKVEREPPAPGPSQGGDFGQVRTAPCSRVCVGLCVRVYIYLWPLGSSIVQRGVIAPVEKCIAW